MRVCMCTDAHGACGQEGEVMGSGGGDQLILAEDDEHDDEIRRGARGLGDLGGLGSLIG